MITQLRCATVVSFLAASIACSSETPGTTAQNLAISATSPLQTPSDTAALGALLRSDSVGRLTSQAEPGAWEFWDAEANASPKRARTIIFSSSAVWFDNCASFGSACAAQPYAVYADAQDPKVFGITIEKQSFILSKHETEDVPPNLKADAFHFQYADVNQTSSRFVNPNTTGKEAFTLRRYRLAE